MEDYRQQITYDEDWQSVSEPEIPVLGAPGGDDELVKDAPGAKKRMPRQPVLTFQLICCLLLALAAFVLKGIGGKTYSAVREWYISNLNQTAIFDGKGGFSLPDMFAATSDEA